ncbi:uncharacterized protein TA15810 [Theileria annulata]|uniref:J domain-containing protein n=1 Tax=Theileria annulata TaxID=5874 RepID=Q4UFP5_THEAN|nr:uncharacterized protein TA15810 [Theileria annulata]CAI74071.1 hypothetical protein TA15810 [Theileria annulata]|eukprot:XP_951803.1 hypothetical protein TA15810 [Theileria annulata]
MKRLQPFNAMESYMINKLTDAVRILELSNELKIDFPKVKSNYNRIVKSVHPDKNCGLDRGLDSVLEAYKLLDYYFNVVLNGKNRQLCHLSCISDSCSCYDTRHGNSQQSCRYHKSENSEPLTCTLCKPNQLLEDSPKSRQSPTSRFRCINSKDNLSSRFYIEISRNSLDVFEGIPYVTCRCGQILFITKEATALGIQTFDCDVCSCSYNIV